MREDVREPGEAKSDWAKCEKATLDVVWRRMARRPHLRRQFALLCVAAGAAAATVLVLHRARRSTGPDLSGVETLKAATAPPAAAGSPQWSFHAHLALLRAHALKRPSSCGFDTTGASFPAPQTLPDLPAGVLPVVMYVARRPRYFEVSLTSLVRAGMDAAAEGLQPLIIISHDGMHEGMDAVVRRAVAALPDSHPGIIQLVHPSPVSCYDARSVFDKGEGPPMVLAVKRHWWWMMQRVWDTLLPRRYDGPVLFLEEDHVVSPDALLMLHAMVKSGECSAAEGQYAATGRGAPVQIAGSSCFGFCLSSRSLMSVVVPKEGPSPATGSGAGEVSRGMRRLELRRTFGFHNTGYALRGREMWERLAAQEAFFWAGGYGWDWAMWRLMQRPYSAGSRGNSSQPWAGRRGRGVAGREGVVEGNVSGLPTTMLYPVLSRVHNVGDEGGATVSESNMHMIHGIPWAGGDGFQDTRMAATMPAVSSGEFHFAGNRSAADGLDPRTIMPFHGSDYYDCLRFESGAFGASRSQLDCPPNPS